MSPTTRFDSWWRNRPLRRGELTPVLAVLEPSKPLRRERWSTLASRTSGSSLFYLEEFVRISPSLRERIFCISMFVQLGGQLLRQTGREWFDACRLAFQNLSDYGEPSPELLAALDALPAKDELVAMLRQSPYLRVGNDRTRILRLVPWDRALFGRRCPSSGGAGHRCRCLDKC